MSDAGSDRWRSRRWPLLGAAAIGLGARVADPIIGLVITIVILNITWDSWRTIRQHDHHHDH